MGLIVVESLNKRWKKIDYDRYKKSIDWVLESRERKAKGSERLKQKAIISSEKLDYEL